MLTFSGVCESDLGVRHLSKWWGYEEVHVAGGLPELRVALDSGAAFHIRLRRFGITAAEM
jgi:hypothetical protein